jgi:FkbH-like protein
MRFRKWGKLSSNFYNAGFGVEQNRKYTNVNVGLVKVFNTISDVLTVVDKTRKFNGGYIYYRDQLLKKMKPEPGCKFDDFLIECYSFEKEPFRFIIENNQWVANYYKNSVVIQPGHNVIRIPVKSFSYKDDLPIGTITVYPENDIEARIVFTWLDFVKYKERAVKKDPSKPADKIKCVAWDLDNTLWKGVFIESEPGSLVVAPEVIATIKKLDEMGVLQTIVSKNTHDEVWPFIQSLGLDEYFLFPAINWGQKSENLKKIADLLNINIDTFGLIDDSPFERQEVSTSLPQVRVYQDTEMHQLFGYPEFDLPVTQESRNRRSFYLIEQKRTQIAESYANDYQGFLRNCNIVVTVFTPKSDDQLNRCFELVQRTNQLNLSSRKYDRATFDSMISDDKYLKFGLEVEDQFGAYGIIGFVIVEKAGNDLRILDFVISCRVAQKMIEDSFVTWLWGQMRAQGKKYLLADHTRTSRNGKILTVFEAIGFVKEDLGDDKFLLRIDTEQTQLKNDIITVKEGHME